MVHYIFTLLAFRLLVWKSGGSGWLGLGSTVTAFSSLGFFLLGVLCLCQVLGADFY